MKKDIGSYVPFAHDNFEFKKNVIDLARKQPATFEGIHTATLIYVNAVDYIAQHLLENLMHMTYLITHSALNGTAFYNHIKPRKDALGKTMSELNKYDFPDKADFMSGLKDFSEIRNKLVHNLLSLNTEQINKISDDFSQIKLLSEALLNKYDTITNGINVAWVAYVTRLVTAGRAPISTTDEVKENNQKGEQKIVSADKVGKAK